MQACFYSHFRIRENILQSDSKFSIQIPMFWKNKKIYIEV